MAVPSPKISAKSAREGDVACVGSDRECGMMRGRGKSGKNGRRGRDTQQARQTTGAKFRGGRALVETGAPNECTSQSYSSATHGSAVPPDPASRFRDQPHNYCLHTRFRDTSRLRLRCSSSRCSFISSLRFITGLARRPNVNRFPLLRASFRSRSFFHIYSREGSIPTSRNVASHVDIHKNTVPEPWFCALSDQFSPPVYHRLSNKYIAFVILSPRDFFQAPHGIVFFVLVCGPGIESAPVRALRVAHRHRKEARSCHVQRRDAQSHDRYHRCARHWKGLQRH